MVDCNITFPSLSSTKLQTAINQTSENDQLQERENEAKYEKPKDTLQRGNEKSGITIEIDQPKVGQKYTNKRNAARMNRPHEKETQTLISRNDNKYKAKKKFQE